MEIITLAIIAIAGLYLVNKFSGSESGKAVGHALTASANAVAIGAKTMEIESLNSYADAINESASVDLDITKVEAINTLRKEILK
jgi:hypothetical protein